jgi:glycosyltransferase involved in cell wall biosynthesis
LPHAWSSISRALSRFVTKYATVVVISKAVANFVLRNGEVDRRKNLNVIYYSFQRKRNTAKVATEIQTSSIERGQSVRLGTVARLTEQKGLIFLLMGMKQLMENGINFTLEIMGSGPQRDLIKRQIVELNLTENVHLIGVSDDPFNFMSSLDFFVLTSKYEGFGLVLLEAMDTQTPIVATNISAIPEVLGESHPGLFAPNSLTSFCETLIALLGNETLRRSCMLIQNERLAFFTEYPQEERYRTLYGELPLLRLSQH